MRPMNLADPEVCCPWHVARGGDDGTRCRTPVEPVAGMQLRHRNAHGRGRPWVVRSVEYSRVVMDRGPKTRWEAIGSVRWDYEEVCP